MHVSKRQERAMDPLAIGATAAGLTALCTGIIGALRSMFSDHGRTSADPMLNNALDGLEQDLTSLSQTLATIDQAWRDNATRLEQHVGENNFFWTSVRNNLDSCTVTLENLDAIVRKSRRKNDVGHRFFRWRASTNIDPSASIHQQAIRITFHQAAMQGSLQMLGICLRLQDPTPAQPMEQSIQELETQISRLETSAKNLPDEPPPYSRENNNCTEQGLLSTFNELAKAAKRLRLGVNATTPTATTATTSSTPEAVEAANGNASPLAPLYLAALNGHLEVARTLLHCGASPESLGPNGWTPLSAAIGNGHTDLVYLLCENNANIHSMNGNEQTPLFVASDKQNLTILNYLIYRGASSDVNVKTDAGLTPLFRAAWMGSFEIVKRLLELEADKEMSDLGGRTPLFAASAKGKLPVVKLLVECKANLEARAECGSTPLLESCRRGEIEVVKYLEQAGARTDVVTLAGATPFAVACYHGRLEVVKYLHNRTGYDTRRVTNLGWTPFGLACTSWNMSVALHIYACGNVNADESMRDGKTPMSIAAKSGRLHTVKWLAALGAKTDTAGYQGETPFLAACEGGQLAVVRYLRKEQKARIAVKDSWSRTPTHVASNQGHIEILKFLIAEGAQDLDTVNSVGETPLYSAACMGHVHIVTYLLAQGASVEKAVNQGYTMLAIACHYGRLDMVKYLVGELRMDPCQLLETGATPVYHAARSGKTDVVHWFIEHGVVPSSNAKHHWTPLIAASFGGFAETARCLALAEPALLEYQCPKRHRTALGWAASGGHNETVKALIECGAKA